jgi:uncharacterized protein
MSHGLSDSTVNAIKDVFSRHPEVRKALLYGSRAKGRHKPGSDIDLTLVGDEGLDLNRLFGIMDELDDLLLPYSIDLSLHRDIEDPDVLAHIQRVGTELYRQDDCSETVSAHCGSRHTPTQS